MPSHYNRMLPSTPLSIMVSLLLLAMTTKGQQQAQFTQYMFNGLVINPAYAGADGALSITALNRSQWLGVDGAPVTQTLSAHSPVINEHTAVGLSIINDKIGIHKNLIIHASYAYRLAITKTSSLSMGIQAGIDNKKSDYSLLTANTPGDQNQFQSNASTFFDFGAGVYFNSSRLQVGFSVPNMIPGKVSLQDTIRFNLNPTQYFLFTKYSVSLNQNLKVEPGFLVKYLSAAPLSFDINVNMVVREVFTTGISYRRNESLDFLCKLKFSPQLMLGFAYDFPIGKITSISNGTYELMVNYAFRSTYKTVSPR